MQPKRENQSTFFDLAVQQRGATSRVLETITREVDFTEADTRVAAITEPDPLAAFQGELAVYHDDVQDFSTNEPTMDGTASAILMFVLSVDGQ